MLRLPLSIFVLIFLLQYVRSQRCVVKNFEEVEEALNCQLIVLDNLFVPAGVTLKLNLTDGAEVVFRGNTSFGVKYWFGPLVTINGTNITVRGEKGSVIDGLGHYYWDGKGTQGHPKPQFFTVQVFGGSVFRDLHIVNSPIDVLQVTNSDNVLVTNWLIDNLSGDPDKVGKKNSGHNTDGFDVWNSTNVIIENSIVYNQDDCVALRCGANMTVRNMYCHGSHGLSISVGFINGTTPLNVLRNVSFYDSVLEKGRNGIHIKTHVNGGYGNITGVLYRNITFRDVSHFGIQIHENYPSKTAAPRNNVPITDLVFENVTGSVLRSAMPVNINCADDGCFHWTWSGVRITGELPNKCNFEPEGFKC